MYTDRQTDGQTVHAEKLKWTLCIQTDRQVTVHAEKLKWTLCIQTDRQQTVHAEKLKWPLCIQTDRQTVHAEKLKWTLCIQTDRQVTVHAEKLKWTLCIQTDRQQTVHAEKLKWPLCIQTDRQTVHAEKLKWTLCIQTDKLFSWEAQVDTMYTDRQTTICSCWEAQVATMYTNRQQTVHAKLKWPLCRHTWTTGPIVARWDGCDEELAGQRERHAAGWRAPCQRRRTRRHGPLHGPPVPRWRKCCRDVTCPLSVPLLPCPHPSPLFPLLTVSSVRLLSVLLSALRLSRQLRPSSPPPSSYSMLAHVLVLIVRIQCLSVLAVPLLPLVVVI